MAKIDPNDLVDIDANDLVDIPESDPNTNVYKAYEPRDIMHIRANPLFRAFSTAGKGAMGVAQLMAHALPQEYANRADAYVERENRLNEEANKDTSKIPFLNVGYPEAAGYIADPLNLLLASKIVKPVMNSKVVDPIRKFIEKANVNRYDNKIISGKIPDTVESFINRPLVSNAPYGNLAKTAAATGTLGYVNGLVAPSKGDDILHERMSNSNFSAITGAALPMLGAGIKSTIGGVGDALSQLTGGGIGIKESLEAGLKGGKAQEMYKKFSEPDSSLANTIGDVNKILPILKQEKNTEYDMAMKEFIANDKARPIDNEHMRLTTHNVDSVMNKVKHLIDNVARYEGHDAHPNITEAKHKLDFLVRDWATRPYDKFHTGPGLDHLKKEVNKLGEQMSRSTQDKQVGTMFDQTADHISKLITEHDPEYARFMKPYADGVQRIKDVEYSLASDITEVGIRKFSKALSTPYKRELLREFEKRDMGELPSILAGYNTKNWLPGNIQNTGTSSIGATAIGGILTGQPQLATLLLAISPKLVSGVANKIGSTRRITKGARDTMFTAKNINLIKELRKDDVADYGN